MTYTLKRNLAVCSGLRSCGRCANSLPELARGTVFLTEASVSSLPIEQVIEECPTGALILEEELSG